MPRQRITHDCYEIQVNYGEGYETECVETNYYAMLINRQAYRENCGYPFRVVRKRYKKTELNLWDMSLGAYYKSMMEWFSDKLRKQPESEHADKWQKKLDTARKMYRTCGKSDPNYKRVIAELDAIETPAAC